MTPQQTRSAALTAAALSVAASALYFGTFGLPRLLPQGLAEHLLGLLAALSGGGAFLLVRRLARQRGLRLAEPVRQALETGVAALAFLYVLYHISHLLRFAAPVALAIDALVPATLLHLIALMPGLVAAAFTEAVWRSPPASPFRRPQHR